MRLKFYALVAFLAALHAYLTTYINSSAAAEALGQQGVVVAFIASALLSLIGFYLAPRILKRLGGRVFLFLCVAVDFISLVLLALSAHPALFVVALIGHLASMPLIGYCLDIFFETAMRGEGSTGLARGSFLTAGNTALVISPLIAGALISHVAFSGVYMLSAGILFLFLATLLFGTKDFKNPTYPNISLTGVIGTLRGRLGAAIWSQFLLRAFYGWAPIYLPLYLTIHLGFSWEETGLILAIALLPFMLFELPLGRLEDRSLGEKEVLILGCIILSGSLMLLILPWSFTLLHMAFILFLTRTGAAMMEIATETSFFRGVTAEHADEITLFRMTQPLGFVTGVIVAASTITFVPFPYAFGVLGGLVLLGIIPALHLHDSK